MSRIKPSLIGHCCLVLVLLSLLLVACGSEPTPTTMPATTAPPTGTARATFTPTSLAQATEEASPTPGTEATARASRTRTAAASPTPPEETPTPAATRAAGPPARLSGTLLFPIFDTFEQTYHVYSLDLKSGEMSKFIDQGSQPSMTWDRKRVSWRSWNNDQRGLLSRPMDSPDTWQMIVFAEAARPSWAPDNQRFVFPSRQEPDRESRLYLFTGVGGDEPFVEIRRHGSPIIGRTPTFFADDRIVYQGCVENACGLYVMSIDGANPQQITEYIDDTTPAVSPDGTKVAYMSLSSGYWQVNVVNADGSDQRRLTDDWYWNGLPVWSPDGKRIIFVSTRDENWPDNFVLSENRQFRLWVMDANGKNQRPLNDFTFRLDGVPARVPDQEVGGWIEERLVWLP